MTGPARAYCEPQRADHPHLSEREREKERERKRKREREREKQTQTHAQTLSSTWQPTGKLHTYSQKKAQNFSPPAAGETPDSAHATPGLAGGRRRRHGHTHTHTFPSRERERAKTTLWVKSLFLRRWAAPLVQPLFLRIPP